jgi:hypothetical protein
MSEKKEKYFKKWTVKIILDETTFLKYYKNESI